MKGAINKRPLMLLAALALWALGGAATAAQDNLPAMESGAEPWKVDVIYENDTRRRGHDKTGQTVGLSKFRNTMQVEADKKLGDGWAFHGVLRGTYDGVYRLNDDQYGKKAGGPIDMQSTTPGGYLTTPWGTGPLTNAVATGAGLPPTNAFVNGYPASNPNDGMRVLGDRWHDLEGGIAFGVPVRPCDTDKRGCRDFGGYGDKKLHELEAPEFNDRLDFIRESYIKKTFTLGDGTDFFLKLGKQQVVWGRTDLFRVLDVINPVDFSRNNIYDELQDIRIPMWIAQGEWRFGGSESMQERNLQVVWNFDQFRPHNLGQCGTANVILDAGCFFRGMANLWDNGGTVSNFANVAPSTLLATNFGRHQIGIRDVDLPDWSLSNTQLGVKFEGVTQGGTAFSVNALTYRSQLPSLHAFNHSPELTNPFTGATNATAKSLIAFDMHFPRVNLIGGSADFQWEAADAAVRLEGAVTHGEEFVNTADPELYSSKKVFRSVIGIDRPTFIPFINPNRTTLISAQLFYQHIFDHERHDGPLGPVGMPDWEDNYIGTLLIKAFLANDRVSPQLLMARDFKAHAWVASPQIEWNFTNDLKLTFGASIKGKSDDYAERWSWDDCRSCNPYPPFTGSPGSWGESSGLSSLEPLGRFRAGPIGTAWKENEVYFNLRYKF